MIRFLLCIVLIIVVFFISLPLFLIFAIIRKFNPMASAKASQSFICGVFRVVRIITGSRIIIKGLENVPKEGPVLYVGNHRSIFDIILSYPFLKNNTGFVAKESLKKTPLVGWWMWYLNCLFLNRENIKEGLKTILKGVELVKNESSIFIFPEGTRSETKDLLPFKEGSLKIAEKGKCPIVPVAITNTEAVFENHFPAIKKATVVFEFGKPFNLDDLDKETKKHAAAYTRDIIIEMRKKHPDYMKEA